MRYEGFLAGVADRACIDDDDAALVSRAVLLTLSERIGPKESKDAASQLPLQLQTAFEPGDWPELFPAAEFVDRVAGRLGVDLRTAREYSRAVFATLQEAISPGEFEDWGADMDSDYVDLGARYADTGGTPVGLRLEGREFLRRVGLRAGLDEPRATVATRAVMTTFGERISDGEARDLADQLPPPAAEPLLEPGGDAEPIPLREFLELVSRREYEPDFIAREHVRAVLTTARESTTATEWADAVDQLPSEYEELLL